MSELPQRELLYRLKSAIDTARVTGRESANRRVRVLLVENPHGSWSTFVCYNLGKGRREFISQLMGTDTPASSLQATRSDLVRTVVREGMDQYAGALRRLGSFSEE